METVTPDWQHKFTDIKSRNLHSLSNGILSDCNFLVENENNKKIIPAHKLILALASPVFERMFYGALAEKGDLIVVSDVQPDSFKLMLEYIYSDHFKLNSLREAFELYYLSDKYMLTGVQKQCTDYLCSITNVSNACHCYEFAEMFQLANLKEKSKQVIINSTSEILKQPNFTEISMSTLMFILDQDRLNISSEIELFDALVRFSNKRVLFGDSEERNVEQKSTEAIKDPFQELICRVSDVNLNNSTQNKVNGMTMTGGVTPSCNSSNDQNKTMSVNKTNNLIKEEIFKEAVKKIRFYHITPQQFADGPANSKLLTKDEILTLFGSMCKSKDKPFIVPKGFTISMPKRNFNNNNQIKSPIFTDIRSHNIHKGISTDCNFLVGNENNKAIIPAHKSKLALASPVFERMFYGELAEKSDPIVVSDVQPDSFKLMLKYIYSHRLDLTSLRQALELYSLADKYRLTGVQELQEQCIERIFCDINVYNACVCYAFAEMFQLADLREKCRQIIMHNTSEILKQQNFTKISKSTLMFILDQDRLNISSEMELFDALVRFANKRVLFGDSKGGNVQQESREAIEEEIFKEAVKKIRFLTMTPEEFADGPAKSKLLTKDEILTFKSNRNEVPYGFTTSNAKRSIQDNLFYNNCYYSEYEQTTYYY